jgi:signal transduction histidine kinase
VLRCAWGSPELPGGAQAAPLPAGGFAALFEEALAGRVSVHADARTPADAGAAAEGALPADVRTLCVVPLLRQGRLAAALVATDRRARRWSSRERGLLRAVAERVWPVFETARLLEAEQRARLLAESANAAKSRFLATMSHELRTPLNAIAGYAELIAMGIHGPVTEAQQDALGRLRRSQRHLLALIDDVLQYAHLEAGRVSYRREPVSMCAAVADAARLVEPVALTRGITLDASALDGVSEEALTVVADAERVRQVVRNLLSNAVKFTAPGGRVMVSLSDGARGTVTLRVADTGVGIPSDRLADVFEPFVQVDAELTRTREGTGLGLAISRDLARGMGGELAVGSEVGRGSVFTLTLPAARAE